MVSTNISIILDSTNPIGVFTGMNTLSQGLLFNFGFLGIFGIIIAGISFFNGIENGFLVGGLFGSFIAIGMFALGYLSILTVLIPVFILCTGIFLKIQSTIR